MEQPFKDADISAGRYALQHQLEELFNKNQLIPRIKAEFYSCKEIDFEAQMEEYDIDVKFGMAVLTQMAIHKRASVSTLVGVLRHHFTYPQEVANELLKCVEAGLILYDEPLGQFIVCFWPDPEVMEEIDRYQYPLPMVVQPIHLKDNLDTGYITPLCSRGSLILKDNHHDEDICLDHLNRLNSIKFRINKHTADMVQNSWRNLDKPKPGESNQDYQKRKKAFDKYDRTARDVIALVESEGETFYLTHKYDKRGRTYCQGYAINYQGTPWNKAVVEFAHQEVPT
tara:strand:+ start:219 stop:1070 length:852 start_codon:yes stop_codon:yes gene_type:complete